MSCAKGLQSVIFLLAALWFLGRAAWIIATGDVPAPKDVAVAAYLALSWQLIKEVNV